MLNDGLQMIKNEQYLCIQKLLCIELLNSIIGYEEGCRLTFPTIKLGDHQMNFGKIGEKP